MQPLRIFFYKDTQSNTPTRTIEIARGDQFRSFQNPSTPSSRSVTPRSIYTPTNDLREVPTRSRYCWRCAIALLLGLLLLLAAGIFGMLVAALVLLDKSTTTTTTTMTTTTTTDTTTTTTTSTTTTSTTTAPCNPPFAQASSGACVNLIVDWKNCGKLDNVCAPGFNSCSEGICSTLPRLMLVNATSIWSASVDGAIDDASFPITLPFNVTFYNTTTDSLTVTTNGVVCIGVCATTFAETNLPTSAFPGITFFPYWDDLSIVANTSQGIYYATQGTAPNRATTFEYYCSHYAHPSQLFQFQVVFFENKPNVVQYIYYNAADAGASCTVGVQKSSSGPFIKHSFDQASSVPPNRILTFRTDFGNYTVTSF